MILEVLRIVRTLPNGRVSASLAPSLTVGFLLTTLSLRHE